MSVELLLPQWGMGMTEGTVTEWFKAEGDTVAAGEEVVEIDTAKAVKALEAPVAGVLEEILVGVGETVPVRTALARIGDAG